jgi:signal transduction histidine kinase/ActR/RegA family two-component response regulator
MYPLYGNALIYLTLYPAVTLAAIMGGFGPGVLVAGVSGVVGLIVAPEEGFGLQWREVGPAEWFHTTVFVGCSVLISAVGEAAVRSRRRLLQRSSDLVRSNTMLRREVERREEVERRLRASEERFRFATAEGITLFEQDASLRYTWLYPVQPEFAKALGKTDAELLAGDQSVALMNLKTKVLATGNDHRCEVRVDLPSGPKFYHVFMSARRSESGEIVGVGGTALDITTRKQTEGEVARARDEALTASRAKDDFLSALSHEMRTPLNPVLLIASEAANNEMLAPEVRRDFSTIRKSVELEARLIDDLLDLTRIANGQLLLERRTVGAEYVLRDALSVVSAEAEEKRVAVLPELQFPEALVNVDTVRLQQVFWNVLRNAVKFTPPGGKVTVRTFPRPDEPFWRVTIEDTGIGMTAREIERVFEAFSQGDHAAGRRSHRFGGLGLGLTISRRLIELQGGRISAASAGPGKGSTFTIELPQVAESTGVIPNTDAFIAPGKPGEENVALAGIRRVLVVEDHAPTREALAGLLRRRSLEVLTAGSIGEARERALLGNISLVVSDIGLPDGNGCDLMEELRRTHGLRGIALTGYGQEADVARSTEAGFSAHLTKPVHVQALVAALEKAWASERVA